MEMKKRIRAAAIVLLGLAAVSCTDEAEQEPGRVDPPSSQFMQIPLDGNTRSVVSNSNDFAIRLLGAEYSENNDGTDICVSPLSVFMTLSMMANGDNGATRDEILTVLAGENEGMEISDLNSYCQLMNQYLPEVDKSTTVGIANSVWVTDGMSANKQFGDILTEFYLAGSYSADLYSEKGKDELNNWIKDKTNGIFEKFLENPLCVDLALVNASYFKGIWSARFNSKNTKKSKFHCADGSEVSVDFMTATSAYNYADQDGMKAIRLPYGNGNYEMLIVSPDDWSPVSEWLTSDKLENLLNSAAITNVNLKMPKFTRSSNGDILSVLNRLGIKKASEDGFNAMLNEGDSRLSMFLHGVDIKVDEEGTEGAAVSIGGFELLNTTIPKSADLTLDHPFVYIVRETSTGSIIFAGTVSKF